MTAARPQAGEFPEYFGQFIDKVPDGDILRTLAEQGPATGAFLRELPEDRGWFRPSDDRWSLREVVGHVIDTERVMAYRALHMARGGSAELPGFDHEHWVAHSEYDERTLADLANEFELLRACNVPMFGCFETDAWTLPGKADGKDFTARGLAWFLAGHVNHHMDVARKDYM